MPAAAFQKMSGLHCTSRHFEGKLILAVRCGAFHMFVLTVNKLSVVVPVFLNVVIGE